MEKVLSASISCSSFNASYLDLKLLASNEQQTEGTCAVVQALKRGYVAWNKQMDDILTRVLLEQLHNKEKGDGDFKPQA